MEGPRRNKFEKPKSDYEYEPGLESGAEDNLYDIKTGGKLEKKPKLELFNRLPNTNIGYGNRWVRKPSKTTLGVESEFDVEKGPDGKIVRMVRKNSNADLKFSASLPEGFSKASGFAENTEINIQEEEFTNQEQDSTDPVAEYGPKNPKQRASLVQAILSAYKGVVPKDILKAVTIAGAVAATQFLPNKPESGATDTYENNKTSQGIGEGKMVEVELIIPDVQKVGGELKTPEVKVVESVTETRDVQEKEPLKVSAVAETDYEAETFPYDISPMGVVADEKKR